MALRDAAPETALRVVAAGVVADGAALFAASPAGQGRLDRLRLTLPRR